MTQAVVLVEEQSAAIVLKSLAAKLDIAPIPIIIPHQGKHDLDRSIKNKLANWRTPEAPRFLIVRDNDGAVCTQIKGELLSIVPEHQKVRTKIRIVLQELESWYLGDVAALKAAGILKPGEAVGFPKKQKFRDPDAIRSPKAELKKLLSANKDYQSGQIALARRIAPHLSLHDNRSRSFQLTVNALQWASEEMEAAAP